jgi:hypothetical protein
MVGNSFRNPILESTAKSQLLFSCLVPSKALRGYDYGSAMSEGQGYCARPIVGFSWRQKEQLLA